MTQHYVGIGSDYSITPDFTSGVEFQVGDTIFIDNQSDTAVTMTVGTGFNKSSYTVAAYYYALARMTSVGSGTITITTGGSTRSYAYTIVTPPVVTYTITTTVTNGTSSGATTITSDGTATVIIAASSGYTLPASVTVRNATYTYNRSTGTISLSSPTANVTISAVCAQSDAPCRININGTWKQGVPYVNVGGTWKQGTAYIKVNGEWKH